MDIAKLQDSYRADQTDQTDKQESNVSRAANYIRDPFSERPIGMKDMVMKKSKRTQRYRSTARSRICGMTVGDIRYCFAQLRNAGPSLRSDFVLYTGQFAGEFALSYLIETSNSMRQRKKQKKNSLLTGTEIDEIDEDGDLPQSQIPAKRDPQDFSKVNRIMNDFD